MSYLIGILREIWDIFLSGCSQILSLLNVESRGICKTYKSLIQREKFFYK